MRRYERVEQTPGWGCKLDIEGAHNIATKNIITIMRCVRSSCDLLFGLLVCVFVGIVCQRSFVASVLGHVVPCYQTLANGCSPRLKTLVRRRNTMIGGTRTPVDHFFFTQRARLQKKTDKYVTYMSGVSLFSVSTLQNKHSQDSNGENNSEMRALWAYTHQQRI